MRVSELHKRLTKGQTMTEYALILAAVAVVVFVTYEVMGQDISTLVNHRQRPHERQLNVKGQSTSTERARFLFNSP